MSWFNSVFNWFLKSVFSKLSPIAIEKVSITKEALSDIIALAKANHPRESSAFLAGKISGKILRITHLLFQNFYSDNSSAWIEQRLPLLSDAVGSVHSHPSGSNSPSRADLEFFAKTGTVHIIVCFPYHLKNIRLYDINGKPLVLAVQM
ncbi:MAG: Mov34/MPN/PAD-1 family protein [Candidatus Woesearchaeota archaeon]|nr:Mov34/MPN/PAD-1 family protein [Candidatus Woesearchaeota archaeon]